MIERTVVMAAAMKSTLTARVTDKGLNAKEEEGLVARRLGPRD